MKYSIFSMIAGIIMIIVSIINYSLNDDYISLGIFGLSGLAFIAISAAEYTDSQTRKQRLRHGAGLFFALAFLVFIYWIAEGKLHLF